MENKLYRSRSDRWLLGVCGGLAKYFSIDPILVRLLAILLALAGFGVVAYVLFAVFVPLEKSEQKTQEGVIQENAEDIQKTAERIGTEIKNTFAPKDERDSKDQKPEEHPHTMERRRVWVALILIGIGIIVLFSALGVWRFFYGIAWAVILIVIGVVILLASRRKTK